IKTNCPGSFSEVQFSAKFTWAHWEPTEAGMKTSGSPLEIRIGKVAGEKSKTLAQIYSQNGGQSQAVSEMKAFEKKGAFTPGVMDLACESVGFGALSAPAALVWANDEGTAPSLRFGSWLNGYKQASLTIEIDHFSQPIKTAGKLAQAQ